jgi:hypothetical protein
MALLVREVAINSRSFLFPAGRVGYVAASSGLIWRRPCQDLLVTASLETAPRQPRAESRSLRKGNN